MRKTRVSPETNLTNKREYVIIKKSIKTKINKNKNENFFQRKPSLPS